MDAYEVGNETSKSEIRSLYTYIAANFDQLAPALHMKPLLAMFIRDQLKNCLREAKGPNGKRGFRYSHATTSICLQMMCNGANNKTFERINDMDIIRLPSAITMKLRRYKFQHQQGVTKEQLIQMQQELVQHRTLHQSVGKPLLAVGWDEMFGKEGVIYNPQDNSIMGLSAEFEKGNVLCTVYDVLEDISKGKAVDGDLITKNSGKVILQTMIMDVGSNWRTSGPFWSSHKTMTSLQMYRTLVDELLLGLLQLGLSIHFMFSDMSSPNLSFILSNSEAKNSRALVGKPIQLIFPFYSHPVTYMFDAPHTLKGSRNTLESSSGDTATLKSVNGGTITIDHLRQLYRNDTAFYVENRTLSQSCLWLNPWSRQRVGLALQIMNEIVVSKLKQIEEFKGTCEYIENVRRLLVGSFVAPSKGTGAYDYITSTDNALLDTLKSSYSYFERFFELNPGVHVKKQLMISSIRYGFEEICKVFCVHYAEELEQQRGQERVSVFLRPSRLGTNWLEKSFGKARSAKCDAVTQYAKAPAMIRMQKDLNLQIKARKMAQGASSGSTKRERGYIYASRRGRRKRHCSG